MVIPAPIRQELGIREGSELVALVDDGTVVLVPRAEIKRRLRGLFAGVRPSLSRELIADRRRQARREEAE